MKRKEPVITQDELMAAIEEAKRDFNDAPVRPPGCFTAAEFCAKTGSAETSTRIKLRKLVASGAYEKFSVTTIDAQGRRIRIPVYRKVKNIKP